MKIISWNVNGLRAVHARQGLKPLLILKPDVICLQEIKLQEAQLPTELADVPGYKAHFNFANKKGYSGVAIYANKAPEDVRQDVIWDEQFNEEGRALLLEFDRYALLNLYMPHGGRDQSKLEYKLRVYSKLLSFLRGYRGKPLIMVGDFNVAHYDLDLARPKQNRKNIMFTAEERAQLDGLTDSLYIDSFRSMHPDDRRYSWWPYLATARERNIGWRIDYAYVPNVLSSQLQKADILTDISGSDHCPISLDVGV